MAKTLPKRDEIPVERTWNLEAIFSTDEDWEKEYQSIGESIPTITNYKGHLGESAENFMRRSKRWKNYRFASVNYMHILICVTTKIRPIASTKE